MNAASVFDNARIAAVFEEIADLLEVQDENPFRIRAYRNAARMVRQQGPDFAARAARGEALAKMFGIGADLDA
ncbi:MAG TPA: helix-hairpin-helix domain-containing protein, partial [Burkholderiaceae bacterium]|nr:helix-hairpin-helix domain-containing protein [Burkholderiaceae bacterium]